MRDRTFVIGSATGALAAAAAALLSVACCIVPAIYAALGAAGAVAAHSLAPYRPVMLGSSAVFLGIGFWRAYRPRAQPDCGTGSCGPGTGRGARAVLWIAALVVFGSALSPLLLPSAQAEAETGGAATKVEARVLLRIDGMTCAGCDRGVSTALSALPSVTAAQASFSQGAACAELAGPVDEADIRQAVADAGYPPLSVEVVDACPEGLRSGLRTP